MSDIMIVNVDIGLFSFAVLFFIISESEYHFLPVLLLIRNIFVLLRVYSNEAYGRYRNAFFILQYTKHLAYQVRNDLIQHRQPWFPVSHQKCQVLSDKPSLFLQFPVHSQNVL